MIASSTSISEQIRSARQFEKAVDWKAAEDIYIDLLKIIIQVLLPTLV